jgi:hypothetical protein
MSNDDVKYTNQSGQMATPPESLEVRSTPSTEVGHTAAKIQHVKLDTGDGTNTQPVALSATDNAVIDDIAANQTDGTQKTKLVDAYGWAVEATPMDELRVATTVRLSGATFTGTVLDPNFWTTIIAASGGTIATADITTMPGALTLSSKTDAAGSVIVQSNRYARYVGGSANRYRSQVQFGDAGLANNTKRWGLFDGTNGCYFKLSGTTLSVCTIKAGVEVAVASAAWNGSTTTPTLTNCNTFEIYITNRKVYFVISGTLVHTIDSATTTWTATTTLPVRADNINSNNTTNTIMYVRVMTAYRLGELETQVTSKYQTGQTAGLVLKYGAGNIRGIAISGVAQSSIITIYDNTAASGTILWSSGAMATKADPFNIELYNAPFSIGLTLVISGASANATVVYE